MKKFLRQTRTHLIYNDGGRKAAGFAGEADDCVTRAIAIAAALDYRDVYDALSAGCKTERRSKRRSARSGVDTTRKWFKDYMAELGFTWVPTMSIGSGCRVHLRADELPAGRIICNVSRHVVAVIDGVVHDTHDPTRDGARCVYGYWTIRL